MTGTDLYCLHTNQSRSYLNHLVNEPSVSINKEMKQKALLRIFRAPAKSNYFLKRSEGISENVFRVEHSKFHTLINFRMFSLTKQYNYKKTSQNSKKKKNQEEYDAGLSEHFPLKVELQSANPC